MHQLHMEFWRGRQSGIDLKELTRNQVSVKGQTYSNPLRFLEIYGNAQAGKTATQRSGYHPPYSAFLPRIPDVELRIGPGLHQPPFLWKDCSTDTLCGNFTYNTNAIYRILRNLAANNKISASKIPALLDDACLMLANIYRHRDHHVIQHINNNLNMYFITKVIEVMLGKSVYDSSNQEPELVTFLLEKALSTLKEHFSYPLREKIAVAIGKGVSFLELPAIITTTVKAQNQGIREISNRYYGHQLAIDHRDIFLEKITAAGQEGTFILAVIMDDTAESVDDFLWMQDLLSLFPFLTVEIILNTAQVSINFSSKMLDRVLKARELRQLSKLMGNRLYITEIFCPLISFQENCLPRQAQEALNRCNAVYIKGANFFETLQLRNKDTFYGFVVCGPVSRRYTGLKDNDAVFAYIPEGKNAFEHKDNKQGVANLRELVTSQV